MQYRSVGFDQNVIGIDQALSWGQDRLSTCPRWKVAHLALDGAGVVPPPALVGGSHQDLEEDRLFHARPALRGKTRHRREGYAGRSRPCARRTACRDRSPPDNWPRTSAGGGRNGSAEGRRAPAEPGPGGASAASRDRRAASREHVKTWELIRLQRWKVHPRFHWRAQPDSIG